jgi:hypothetical protein
MRIIRRGFKKQDKKQWIATIRNLVSKFSDLFD